MATASSFRRRRTPAFRSGASRGGPAWIPALGALALLLLGFAPTVGQERAADPADVSTLDGIIRAYYEVVSGPAGGVPDRERDRTLHLPGAVVGIPVDGEDGTTRVATMSLDQYHDRFGGPRPEGFWEREIHRVVHRFGNVAQVMSTYASSTSPDGEPFARGVNSIQLTWDGTRWWIVSWVFDQERPGYPIPPELLPRGGPEGP